MSPDQNKNIVKGSISNIKGDVRIGDYTIHQEKYKSSKELTTHLPTLREDQIIGRKEDIADIYQRLFDNKQVVLVNGMGGIGKTTIAQVYLTKYYDEYKYIAWIGLINDADNFESEFVNTEGLLDRFHIKKEGKTIRELFVELIGAFKEIDERPCLMIIDNATHSLEKYRTYLPNQPNWHLLVTSRERIVDFDLKELGFLDEEEAVLLFKKYYTRSQLSDDFIKDLVKDLEYHTLTIEILAKTAQAQRTAPDQLLNAIQNDLQTDTSIRHSTEKVEKLTSYLCSIFKTSDLQESEKWLLKQFICLPPEYFSFDMLEDLIWENEQDKATSAGLLNSLAQSGWLLHNEGIDSYRIHRIIIDVVKRSIELKEKDINGLILKVSQKLSLDATKDNPINKFQWIPFGKSVLHHFEDSMTPEISVLQNNLATVLKDLGDFNGAKVLLEKAMKSTEKNFGDQHPTTAVSYSNLALVLQDLGDFNGAKILLEKAMKSTEKNFGDQHPTTAVSYSNLATVLQDLGDFNGAKILLEKAMKSTEKNFGNQHPTTAVRYSNLALVLQDLGDFNGAKVLLEKAMKSTEKNFGNQHPSTAVRYSNLATVLQDLGDFNGAKVLLEKAMKSTEKNFGDQHPTTAVNYLNLGTVHYSLKSIEEAKKYIVQAYHIFKTKLGEEHPNTKTAKSWLDGISNEKI